MIPAFVPGGMGPPELFILLVVLTIFLGIPIAIGIGIVKLVTGSGGDERIAELEQRVDELENERS